MSLDTILSAKSVTRQVIKKKKKNVAVRMIQQLKGNQYLERLVRQYKPAADSIILLCSRSQLLLNRISQAFYTVGMGKLCGDLGK